MSDIYLVLRNRLDSVAEWVTLGPEMRTARERLGLSRAAIAREIPVVEKTYERWEKRGQVPRPFLPAVANLLHLEIETPEQVKIAVTPNGPDATVSPAQLEAFASALERLESMLARYEDALERLGAAQAEGTPDPSAR